MCLLELKKTQKNAILQHSKKTQKKTKNDQLCSDTARAPSEATREARTLSEAWFGLLFQIAPPSVRGVRRSVVTLSAPT